MCARERESQGTCRSSASWKTTKIKGDSQTLSQVDFLEENLSIIINDSEHKLSLNVKQNGFGIQPYMHEILANKN